MISAQKSENAFELFYSYSHRDERWRKRLETHLSNLRRQGLITEWHDRNISAGTVWVNEIDTHLNTADIILLLISPDFIASEYCYGIEMMRAIERHETGEARVIPVILRPTDYQDTPFAHLLALPTDAKPVTRWKDREQALLDVARGIRKVVEEWNVSSARHLKSSSRTNRVAFMAPDLPQGFIERPGKLIEITSHLLDESQSPRASLVALQGGAGFGKSTLATAVSHDEDVQEAFDDGILWVTLGRTPNIVQALAKLYTAITGELLISVDAEEASRKLSQKLSDKDYLIVIDDVWNITHLRPFLFGGERCARLITTRNLEVVVASMTTPIIVDVMTVHEAVSLLTFGMEQTNQGHMQYLASRLGKWPLLLELVNGALRKRLVLGDTIDGALSWVDRALNARGFTAFDSRDAEERNAAIARSIDISLALLGEHERALFTKLAIFPDNIEIPLTAISALWDLDMFSTEEMVLRLAELSLLKFSPQNNAMHLHSVMRAYIETLLREASSVHAHLIESWGSRYDLPDEFAWQWYTFHLYKAMRNDELREILLDFRWLQSQLRNTNVNALIANYDYCLDDRNYRLIQSAIKLGAEILSSDHQQLASQVTGRLSSFRDNLAIQTLLESAVQSSIPPWFAPLNTSLSQAGGSLVSTFSCDCCEIYAITVSPDDKYIVSGSADGTVRVWDLETGAPIRIVVGHSQKVYSVAISPDGKYIVSGSADTTVRVWDSETGAEVRTLTGHNGEIFTIAISSDGKYIISGSADETVRVWDLELGTQIQVLIGHSQKVYTVAVSPDGKYIVSGSADETVRVWDLETGTQVRTLGDLTGEVYSVAISPDGSFIAAGSEYSQLCTWSLGSGELINISGVNFSNSVPIFAVAIPPNSEYVLCGDQDRSLWRMSLRSRSHFKILSSTFEEVAKVFDSNNSEGNVILDEDDYAVLIGKHNSIIQCIAVTSDGKYAVTGSYDSTLKVWDLTSIGSVKKNTVDHSAWSTDIAISRDSRYILHSKTIIIAEPFQARFLSDVLYLDSQTKEYEIIMTADGDIVNALSITDDGHVAILGGGVTNDKVYFGLAYRPLDKLFIPDGLNRMRLISFNESISIWDLEAKRAKSLIGRAGMILALAVTADGRYIVSGSDNCTLKLWSVRGRRSLYTFEGHKAPIRAVAVTSDGRYAVSGSDDHTLKLWDLRRRRLIRTLEGHARAIRAVAVTSDGRYAISGSDDRTLKIWELGTGNIVRTLTGHQRGITEVVTTADGRFILSASLDKTLRLWDYASGLCVAKFNHDIPLYCCTVADNDIIALGDEFGATNFVMLAR